MSARDRIAEALAAHQDVTTSMATPRQYTANGGWNMDCGCGRGLGDSGNENAVWAAHAGHVADAVVAAVRALPPDDLAELIGGGIETGIARGRVSIQVRGPWVEVEQ